MSRPADVDSAPLCNPVIEEHGIMAQTLTFVSTFAVAGGVFWWWLRRRRMSRDDVEITMRLDRALPGAHLIWEIENTDFIPLTLAAFVIRPRHLRDDRRGESIATVPLPSPETLEPGDRTRLSMDVDWRLFDARAVGVCDAAGSEHLAPAAQLSAVQAELRELVGHSIYRASAPDWLSGAANLAFGVVILGLGFFMLMWVLATG
jgi:hypothetical protein